MSTASPVPRIESALLANDRCAGQLAPPAPRGSSVLALPAPLRASALALFAPLCAGVLALAAPLHAGGPDAEAAPPGLVLVPGGRTKIGLETSDLKRLLEADPKSQDYAGVLSAETPQHELVVPSFYLMATEVTNEQYAAYLRATGRRAPYTWAAAAIAKGRDAYLAELEAARDAAIAEGRPVPDAQPFEDRAWWDEHWRDAEFAVPAGDELRPVVFVDWSDARAYARWAGLRLMTEFEYQRAVRGDSTRAYPWGDAWDSEKFAATSLLKKKSGLFPAGSFPAGASKQGLFDLAGNAWEWTSSAYVPYPGYEVKVYTFGFGAKTRQVNAVADYTPGRKVVVGGSVQNGSLMARATTRRAAEPDQASDALGFRCAATPSPGVDLASAFLADELTPNARPLEDGATVVFEPEACVAAQRWDVAPVTTSTAPPGYAAITDQRFVLFTPVKQIACTDLPGFERLTLERLTTTGALPCLGFFATNVRLVEPALDPGLYLVSYRAQGLRKPLPNEKEPRLEDVLGLDPALDWLVFSRLDGTPVRAVRQTLSWGTARDGRAVLVEPEAVPRTEAAPSAERLLRLELDLPTRARGKELLFELLLRFEPGVLAGAWRRTS
ncbi:MAG: SUMF1/EgtB/PvdO family nonheme iron enzyme [Planctomycetes bacterium]|nr:SUMF1/EgtB/PvdO family nonheme iron enzyme [Planctomycetota bacterium]